jgi:hypothetical protein
MPSEKTRSLKETRKSKRWGVQYHSITVIVTIRRPSCGTAERTHKHAMYIISLIKEFDLSVKSINVEWPMVSMPIVHVQ